MKLNNPLVVMPYMTTDGKNTNRTHTTYRFTGELDRKRVVRTVRRSLKSIGISAPKFYILHYIKKFSNGC